MEGGTVPPDEEGKKMSKDEIVESIRELMSRYKESRAAWIEKLGKDFNEEDFNAWFTKQVTG